VENEYLHRSRYKRGEEKIGYRNGYLPERTITLGSGSLKIKAPRVSDEAQGKHFESGIVKPYQNRSQTVSELFPKLFIEGLATRDFEPALRSLLGSESSLSPSTISRLNQKFKDEYESWKKQSLSERRIVYMYADGIYLAAGIGDEKACLLVAIGVDQSGVKHLLAVDCARGAQNPVSTAIPRAASRENGDPVPAAPERAPSHTKHGPPESALISDTDPHGQSARGDSGRGARAPASHR
jgi:transposase-like protein